MDLAHVLWIGGGQGSGKSSVARALARRFDLQLYTVDHRTWVHEPRMPRTDFQSLSLEERWVEPTLDEMLGWFLTSSRHRFRLVLEDLKELPAGPGAVVEGPQLFPTSVSAVLRAPGQALFLVPDPHEQRERLLARGPMLGVSDGLTARAKAVERDLMISELYRREARDLRLRALAVDRPLEGMVCLAAEHFAPALERLPREGDLSEVRRYENGVLATQVRLYLESLPPAVPAGRSLLFACECGASGCTDEVELTLAEYEAISAAGDRSPLRAPRP